MTNKIKNIVVTITFFAIIIVTMIANLIKKDELISISERRKLEQKPQFTLKQLTSGKYSDKLDKYVTDQFIQRENLRKTKVNIEKKLLKKKDYNNLYDQDGYIIEQNYPLNTQSVKNIINKINQIANEYLTEENNIYYTIIPDKNYFASEDHLKIDYSEIEKIMSYAPKKIQTLCFSATIDSKVKKLAYRYMDNPTIIDITENEESEIPNIRQEVVKTTDRWKADALVKILEEDNPFMSIIFCRTKRRADELEIKLAAKGIKAAKIHSDIPQNKREKIMKSFRNCEIQYLIATDVASRGIDVTGVTHIYNYDAPESVESYIHRIGRTARAGDTGYTCLITDPKNYNILEEIEEYLKINIPERYVKFR